MRGLVVGWGRRPGIGIDIDIAVAVRDRCSGSSGGAVLDKCSSSSGGAGGGQQAKEIKDESPPSVNSQQTNMRAVPGGPEASHGHIGAMV